MSIFKQNIEVREVWADNLFDELQNISRVLKSFPLVSLKSEFDKENVTKGDKEKTKCSYREFKIYVEELNLLKIGLTLFDEKGNLPSSGRKYCIWQFNFHDKKNDEKGIDLTAFCSQLKSSGVISDQNRNWVTFSGLYDFGSLIKMLTSKAFPETLPEFYGKIEEFFHMVYDIKHVKKYSNDMDQVARKFKIKRFGMSSQAGSDSLLSARIYLSLKPKSDSPFSIRRNNGALFYGLADN